MPSPRLITEFQKQIWEYHKENRRDLPWRRTHDPYRILVSEMMLQQTQVSRVLIKYRSFLKRFPTVKALASAPLRDVLLEWQGLGYNRRALYLKRTAEAVMERYNGKFPRTYEGLVELPGIGQSTAGALLAFSYGAPAVFIETNIRSVFIHFFFKEHSSVTDKMIRDLVEATVDREDPREWYYALYDYGTMLKASTDRSIRTLHRNSKHYKKQSKFIGSNREIRSNILKSVLVSKTGRTTVQLSKSMVQDQEIILKNLLAMQKEGLVRERSSKWYPA